MELPHTFSFSDFLLALAVILLVKGFDWFKEYLKDRREREATAAQTRALDRIAESNESASDKLSEMNTHMITQAQVQQERHQSLVRTMEAACKADCTNYRKKQQ